MNLKVNQRLVPDSVVILYVSSRNRTDLDWNQFSDDEPPEVTLFLLNSDLKTVLLFSVLLNMKHKSSTDLNKSALNIWTSDELHMLVGKNTE